MFKKFCILAILIIILMPFTVFPGNEINKKPARFLKNDSVESSPLLTVRLYDLWDTTHLPWGLGLINDTIWISDVRRDSVTACSLKQYSIPLESFTGVAWDETFVGYSVWMADMCWDSARGLLWQVAVGGTNGLYGINPLTGSVEDSLFDPSGTWTHISQRGVGYNPETDIFYIGGWNDDIIYEVKGPDWTSPGEIIDTFDAPDCAGIGWDKTTGTIWFGANDSLNHIYQIDTISGAVIHTIIAIWSDGWGIAGLEVANDGTIWHIDMNKRALCHVLNPLKTAERDLPERFSISAFPNPFNSSVRISFDCHSRQSGNPGIEIFDINGRRVQGFEESRVRGKTEFVWSPEKSLPSGVYLIKAKMGVGRDIEKRIIYLK